MSRNHTPPINAMSQCSFDKAEEQGQTRPGASSVPMDEDSNDAFSSQSTSTSTTAGTLPDADFDTPIVPTEQAGKSTIASEERGASQRHSLSCPSFVADPRLTALLKDHGMDRLVQTFVKSEIDFETFFMMTFKDLTELGLPIGPRRKVMSIINEGPGAARKMEDATKDGYELDTEIVGVDHYTGSRSTSTGCVLTAARERNNPYDKNAICIVNSCGTRVGYIPRFVAEGLAPRIDTGAHLSIVATGSGNGYTIPIRCTVDLTVLDLTSRISPKDIAFLQPHKQTLATVIANLTGRDRMSIERLHLAENSLMDSDLADLSELVYTLRRLEFVNLRHNRLHGCIGGQVDSAPCFLSNFQELVSSASLVTFDITGNPMASVDCKAWFQALPLSILTRLIFVRLSSLSQGGWKTLVIPQYQNKVEEVHRQFYETEAKQ